LTPKQIAEFAFGPIVTAVLGFISIPVIAWFYSVEDIGRLSMLNVVTSFCILLFSLGLDQAYVREYHEVDHKPVLLKTAFVPGSILLIFTMALCLLEPGAISKLLFAVDSTLIDILVSLCVLSAFVSRFLSLILRMQERGLAFSMSQILPKMLFLAIIGFYVLFSLGFDLLHLLIAQTASLILVTLVYGWNTRREWIEAIGRKIDKSKLKTMLAFGMPLIIGGLASWGLMTIDRIFLRSMSTFTELGIYSVSVSAAGAVLIFKSVFTTVWVPIVYKWVAMDIDPSKIDQITEHVLATVVFIFILAGLFSWLVTYLLPHSYERVQYIVVACISYPLFYTLSETTVIGLGITRKSVFAMYSSAIALVISVAANYFLVPVYGAAGAAVSTAIAFWAFLFCRTEFSSRIWRPLPRKKLYASTLTCLILACTLSIFGDAHHRLFIGLWLLLLAVAAITFKGSLKSAVHLLSSVYYKRKHSLVTK